MHALPKFDEGKALSVPDRIAILERGLERERNKRKMQAEAIEQIASYLEVVMTFLDDAYNGNRQFHKAPLNAPIVEKEEDA